MTKPMQKSSMSQIPETLYNSKEYKKLQKYIGEENCLDFFRKSEEELRAIIVECRVQKKNIQDSIHNNPQYQQAKGIINDFNNTLRDSVNPLNVTEAAATLIVKYLADLKKIPTPSDQQQKTEIS